MHGVRESPNGLYTNDTMQYLLGLGLGKLRSRHIIHGVRHVEGSWPGPKGFIISGWFGEAWRQGEPVWALHQRHQVPLSRAFGMRRGPGHRPKGFVV